MILSEGIGFAKEGWDWVMSDGYGISKSEGCDL